MLRTCSSSTRTISAVIVSSGPSNPRAKLDTGNEAFKTVFKEFRVDVLENPNSGHEILVAPVLQPDLIEAHAHASGTVRVVSGEDAYDEADPSLGGPGAEPEPLLMLIQPPPSELAIPINMVDYVWAKRLIVVNWPELRIPR